MGSPAVGIRWTVGDVSELGFEALRLSIWGARKVFGPGAAYAVCFNSIPRERAVALAGELPGEVVWHDASGDLPAFIRAHLDAGLAEGVAWKLAPLRCFPDRYEISLDNDCILWELPTAIGEWLAERDPRRCLIAEDARAMFGQFADLCGPEPRNGGIRGLPPGFDLGQAIEELFALRPVTLSSELDEQGLQVALVSRPGPPKVVSLEEVTICSPFPPHRPALGTHGAHFVGLNARHFPWQLDGRYAEEHIRDNWDRLYAALCASVGAPPRPIARSRGASTAA